MDSVQSESRRVGPLDSTDSSNAEERLETFGVEHAHFYEDVHAEVRMLEMFDCVTRGCEAACEGEQIALLF